jgi:hypothetical protein
MVLKVSPLRISKNPQLFIKLHIPIIDNRPLLMIKTFILFRLPIISYQSAFMSFWFFLLKIKMGRHTYVIQPKTQKCYTLDFWPRRCLNGVVKLSLYVQENNL